MNLSKQPRVGLNFVRYSMSRSTKTWSLYSVHCILTTKWPIASSGDVSTQRKKMSPCFQYVGKNLDGKQNSKQSVNDQVVSIEIFYNILLLPPKHCFRKVEKKKIFYSRITKQECNFCHWTLLKWTVSNK